MNKVAKVYKWLVLGNEKAIVGFLVSGLLALLATANVSGEMTVDEALTALLTGALTAVTVWVKANNKR